MLVAHIIALGYAAGIHAPRVDEPVHLAAGVAHWRTGEVIQDIGNPPLVGLVAAIPCAMTDSVELDPLPRTFDRSLDRRFVTGAGTDIFHLVTIARWMLAPFSILGACICYSWARDLYGGNAALLAAALWCSNPDILANGHVIACDLASAACVIAAAYSFWIWLRRPTLIGAVVTGIVIGVAQLSKMVAIILYPIGVAVWLMARARSKSGTGGTFGTIAISRERVQSCLRECMQLVTMSCCSAIAINCGYGFQGTGRPLGELVNAAHRTNTSEEWRADLSDNSGDTGISNGGLWSTVPIVLPSSYWRGIVAVSDVARHPYRSMYLGGKWYEIGPWYYYLFAMLVKMPLGLLILVGLTAALPFIDARRSAGWFNESCLLVPCVTILVFVSGAVGVRFYRYLLPALPFIFIWVSKVGMYLPQIRKISPLRQRVISVVSGSAFGWAVVSSLWIYPHSMSYFNEMAGGPTRGHAHLIDDSIDWGQDLLLLKKWLDVHPEVKPLHLAYRGGVDPRLAGVEFVTVPKHEPAPGWHALGVTCLRGGCSDTSRRDEYLYFLRLQPTAMIGYSIYVYHVTLEDVNRLRDIE